MKGKNSKVNLFMGLAVLALLSHYVGALPLALAGIWTNLLVPGFLMWVAMIHLFLMIPIALARGKTTWLVLVPAGVFITVVLINIPSFRVLMQDTGGNWAEILKWQLYGAFYLALSSACFILGIHYVRRLTGEV